MAATVLSASEFRVRFKELANSVAEEQHRVVVTRHGHRLVVLVSQEDFEFLQKHKPQPTPRLVPDPVPDPFEGIDHPERMKTADIERMYPLTRDTTDPWLAHWHEKAWLTLKLRTGKDPDGPYDDVMPGGASPEPP
jgi:prevent-host-death family protein